MEFFTKIVDEPVLQKPFIAEFKEKEKFYSEKGRTFIDEFSSFFLFLFSN